MKNIFKKNTDNEEKAVKVGAEEKSPNGATMALQSVKNVVKNSKIVKPALIAILAFTIICGLLYTMAVTLTSQVLFPYEANGSQIVVTLKDGTQKVIGSELIGQQYEGIEKEGETYYIHMFGRINPGAPSNLSPESEEYKALVAERVAKFRDIGYVEEDIPSELVSVSGSGLDPHISPEAAAFQAEFVANERTEYGYRLYVNADGDTTVVAPEDVADVEASLAEGEKVTNVTKEFVQSVIDKYTKGRFLGLFGEPTVNVLLVNLALDGLL